MKLAYAVLKDSVQTLQGRLRATWPLEESVYHLYLIRSAGLVEIWKDKWDPSKGPVYVALSCFSSISVEPEGYPGLKRKRPWVTDDVETPVEACAT